MEEYRIYANRQLIDSKADQDEALARFLAITQMEAYKRCHIRVMQGDRKVQEAYPAQSGWQAKEMR